MTLQLLTWSPGCVVLLVMQDDFVVAKFLSSADAKVILFSIKSVGNFTNILICLYVSVNDVYLTLNSDINRLVWTQLNQLNNLCYIGFEN